MLCNYELFIFPIIIIHLPKPPGSIICLYVMFVSPHIIYCTYAECNESTVNWKYNVNCLFAANCSRRIMTEGNKQQSLVIVIVRQITSMFLEKTSTLCQNIGF